MTSPKGTTQSPREDIAAQDIPASEYRAMTEECFKWAREAHTAEVRAFYIQLADVWLKAASQVDLIPQDSAARHVNQSGFFVKSASKYRATRAKQTFQNPQNAIRR
jgi:hypothetical protein